MGSFNGGIIGVLNPTSNGGNVITSKTASGSHTTGSATNWAQILIVAGGGGGGAYIASGGTGGPGGGGNAGTPSVKNGVSGTANTGGGGGAGLSDGSATNTSGGSGGSGIVIVRYPSGAAPAITLAPGTNVKTTAPNGDGVATFTVSGTLTVAQY